MNRIVGITQARIGSSRFPGKSMKMINKSPMLEFHIKQVLQSKLINNFIVATSRTKKDDIIVKFCKKNYIDYFAGSHHDVLSRYYLAAKKSNADIVVRITSDCPLVDPEIIDKCIKIFLKKKVDYLANTNPPENASYPDGFDVEVFSFLALKKAYFECKNKYFREHVTYYFWKNPNKFKIFRLNLKKSLRRYRLTVDYKEDFLLIKNIINHFIKTKTNIRMKKVISYLNKNQNLLNLNKQWNETFKIKK